MKLIKKEDYKVLSTDLKESTIVSNLMDNYPPICKQDPVEVRVLYMMDHFERTDQTIKISDIPGNMYGGALPIAKSRKSKKRAMTEAEYVEDAPKPTSKKAKKSKAVPQEKLADHEVLSIQQEAQELDASEVLDKRTRSKKPAEAPQSSIPKKKRKMAIRKLRQASLAEEDQEQATTSLVTREVLKKRAEEATLKKALEIAAQISVPSDVLLQEASIEAAQAGIELTEDLQQLVVSGELQKDSEEKAARSEAATSEVAASEAARGNPDVSHSTKIIEIESGTSTSTSSPTHTSDSSDIDDVPLNKHYKNISPSTKQKQKASDEPCEPVYPSILDRIGALSQLRVDICNKLPADHPLQPPVVEPLNVAPADAEGSDEPVGSVSANISTSTHSNHPTLVESLNFAQTQTQTQTETEPQQESPTNIPEQSVLENLVSHYSGELPEVESELQKASEVASYEVASESPQQQTIELQTASTSTQIIPDHIESVSCTEEATDMEIEMTNSFSTSASVDISETNIPTLTTNIPTIPTNNQPSLSNLALQPSTPPKPTKIPFPPTMYLDSSLLADVCENIFQELNRLIQSRSDLIHQNSYEQS